VYPSSRCPLTSEWVGLLHTGGPHCKHSPGAMQGLT
jgi:hypothetical protein